MISAYKIKDIDPCFFRNFPHDFFLRYRQTQDAALRRKNGDAPIFGSHYGLRSPPGVIRVGDPVYVNVT